jgi:integrase
MEAIFDFARARGWRTGENPARWKGHLSEVLASPKKLRLIEHRPSLSWREMPAFMAALQEQKGVTPQSLAFLILTAARSGEVRLATWGEMDWENAIWTVPASRMKAKRRHRVPLSPAALSVLETMKPYARGSESFVFPSFMRPKQGLAADALSDLVELMNKDAGGDLPRWRDAEGRAVVPHGFRSTFRDWAGETRPEGREVAEAALAHVVTNRAEAAYARSDLLEKRRPLMDAWGEWCGKQPNQVVKLRRVMPD